MNKAGKGGYKVDERVVKTDVELLVHGPGADLERFKAKVRGIEAYAKDAMSQAFTLHSLFPVPQRMLSRDATKNHHINHWMRSEWGCHGPALNVIDSSPDASMGPFFRVTFGLYDGVPQVWFLRASRIWPALMFEINYSVGANADYGKTSHGRFVYQDGQYLEAVVMDTRSTSTRDKTPETRPMVRMASPIGFCGLVEEADGIKF